MSGSRVVGIQLYPIKSCRGIAVETGDLTVRGLAGDRRWMIVDRRGRALTQREYPLLTLVDVRLQEGGFVVTGPTSSALYLPRSFDAGEPMLVDIWTDKLSAMVHPEGSAWFRGVLHKECRLVYMSDDATRSVKPKYAREGDFLSFADRCPYSLFTVETLADLERRAGGTFEMERFRSNIVVEGFEPYREDQWSAIRIGGESFRVPRRNKRCQVINVDPSTGVAGQEPLRCLVEYRRIDGRVTLGVGLIADSFGTIRVGDPVVEVT